MIPSVSFRRRRAVFSRQVTQHLVPEPGDIRVIPALRRETPRSGPDPLEREVPPGEGASPLQLQRRLDYGTLLRFLTAI